MASEDDRDRSAGGTIRNGVVGAVAGVALFFLPFSTFLGGAVAGYLEGGSARRGALVGAVTAAVTAVPLLVLARLVVWLADFVDVLALPVRILTALVVVFLLGYVLLLSVLGGVTGAYARSSFG